MDYYDREENVQEYIQMADGYDGKALIDSLWRFLPDGSTVLEIGMGPGKDLDILREKYVVTGSDSSDVFLDSYRKTHKGADLLNLDAVTLNTNRRFQCVYSNKVLHHLTTRDMEKSFQRQLEILEKNGVALHSLWHGDGEEEIEGLRFVYYSIEGIQKLVPKGFKILEKAIYKEIENDDSICLIMRKT